MDSLIEEIDRRIASLEAARALLIDAPDMADVATAGAASATGSPVPAKRRGRPRKHPLPATPDTQANA